VGNFQSRPLAPARSPARNSRIMLASCSPAFARLETKFDCWLLDGRRPSKSKPRWIEARLAIDSESQ